MRPFTRFEAVVLPRATMGESNSRLGFRAFCLSLNTPTRLALAVSVAGPFRVSRVPGCFCGACRATFGTAKREPKSAEEQAPEAAASHQAKRLHQSSLKASTARSRKTGNRFSVSRRG